MSTAENVLPISQNSKFITIIKDNKRELLSIIHKPDDIVWRTLEILAQFF